MTDAAARPFGPSEGDLLSVRDMAGRELPWTPPDGGRMPRLAAAHGHGWPRTRWRRAGGGIASAGCSGAPV